MRYLFFLFLLVSCSAGNSEQSSRNIFSDKNTSDILDTKEVFTLESISIVDNYFANNPFGISLALENFKEYVNDSLIVTKDFKPILNQHNNELDTLIHFNILDGSRFVFYKSKYKDFLTSAIIVSDIIRLKSNIRVGATLDEMCSKFELDNSSNLDLIILEDEEGYAEHRFYFIDRILSKIEVYNQAD